MDHNTFLQEKERVAGLSVQEQKDFFARVLEEEQAESAIRLQAYFGYAVLFYYEGNFRRAREILEPFAFSYQSYEYIPEMISCFNLMGVASQCEGEYVLSRYFYNLALRIVEEQKETHYLAYEYNNISLTYIAEQNYETALQYIQKAEACLSESDEKMGAYIYLNKSDIYRYFGRLEEAVEAYETSIREYNGREILPDDTLICGISLFHSLGDQEKYAACMQKVLDQLGDMYASEFIDACKMVFECSLQDENYELVDTIIEKMDDYMQLHPGENKVGLRVEEVKYIYAKKIGDRDAMLAAMEKKNYYYSQIVSRLEKQRTTTMDEYLEINRHLQEAVQNAIQANHAKSRFLANMSHDIRTPMNAIVGITSLMEHSLHDPEKLENYLSKIQLSSRHMLGLVNDLLDMNKIENGAACLNLEPVKLLEQIAQVDDIISPQAAEKNQKFEIHCLHVEHENLILDATRFCQVLLNVLSNSVKYTPAGGSIRLDIEEMPGKKTNRAEYSFTVTDTGIGMDQELVQHIFDPFIRGEDSVVNKIQGTGLGMAITKNIVDLMEGSIEVESQINRGSRITILLEFALDPAGDTHSMADGQISSEKKEMTESALQGMRFLCAEDNELNAEILTAMLEIAGASCIVYPDGEHIVRVFETVKEGEYDAILMDVQMPNMNGYEATRRIRSSKNTLGQTIPIIAMTANAFADDVKNSFAAGMNAHVSKPIDLVVLERAIRRLVKQKNTERQI